MSNVKAEHLFLAGDIGGTNTNLALVHHDGVNFDIAFSMRFSTQAEQSLLNPISRFLDQAKKQGALGTIDSCCISGAGPVTKGSIQLTNAPWSISASEIAERFDLEVHLINDFMAISYAVVLLDSHDAKKVINLSHLDGSTPMPQDGMALVVGAGTGLGVGFIEKRPDGGYQAFPSEGGHSGLPCFDDLSAAFANWLRHKIGMEPGAELAISGQGIVNIFDFLCSGGFKSPGPIARHILEKPESERPALISANREQDFHCAQCMELFADFYARKISNLAALFLPSGGIYLAGGISSKNEAFLIENHRFMNAFEQNYAPHIRDFLATVPVMIVRDYSISLIGAANAALQLMR
jgi:glucokinase